MDTGELLTMTLAAALQGGTAALPEGLTAAELSALFSAARAQRVTALIYGAAGESAAFKALGPALTAPYRAAALREAAVQAARAAAFMELYARLTGAGLRPVVLKGCVCARLYPQPELRPSADEDLLIEAADFLPCHRALMACGLTQTDPRQDPASDFEVSYADPVRGLHIELHKSPFSPELSSVSDLNRPLEGCISRAERIAACGAEVWALNGHDHMLYLLEHALKHFIHSGFGLRQVCDAALWAQAYRARIDWPALLAQCRALGAERFAAAVLRLGARKLGVPAALPDCFAALDADPRPLLEDILAGGIYGGTQPERRHSARVTVAARESERSVPVLAALFPGREKLSGRYPWLRKAPFLLPAAWVARLARYAVSRRSRMQSLRTLAAADRRVALLRFYGLTPSRGVTKQ